MTKGLVTSALGLLVQKGKLRWDARLSQILPDFAPHSAQLSERATLTDVLTMRSGMARYNIWSQSDNHINFSKNQSMEIINSLQSATDLRSDFAYNNWGYEIAEHVCQEVGGESWDSMLHTNFFEPLGLRRTDATGSRDGYDNMSKAYMVLDDGTPVQVAMTPQSGITIMGAARGVVSCVDDLLVINGICNAESLCPSIREWNDCNTGKPVPAADYNNVSPHHPARSKLSRVFVWYGLDSNGASKSDVQGQFQVMDFLDQHQS